MRAWLVLSVLSGCTSGPCGDDPVVGSWVFPATGHHWEVRGDCTWSADRTATRWASDGTWSRADAEVTFVSSPERGYAPMTVTPLRAGDRLAVTHLDSPLPVTGTALYTLFSGGPALAGSVWRLDATVMGDGGSCAVIMRKATITLRTDHTASSVTDDTCEPAGMGFPSQVDGTWTSIDASNAFTFQFPDPADPAHPKTRTWARFDDGRSDGITDTFYVRAP